MVGAAVQEQRHPLLAVEAAVEEGHQQEQVLHLKQGALEALHLQFLLLQHLTPQI
jgi:hypothetical protein